MRLSELKKVAGNLSAEVETLAYPGHLDKSDLLLTDAFFKVVKNKERSPHFGMIKQLVSEDAERLTENQKGGPSHDK